MKKLIRRILAVLLVLLLAAALPLVAVNVSEAGKAYIAHEESNYSWGLPLRVYDTDTHTYIKNIQVARMYNYRGNQRDMALSPSGDRAYIALNDPYRSSVAVVDTASDSLIKRIFLPMRHNFYSIDISPSGDLAYLFASNYNYSGYLFVMDLNTSQIIISVPLGGGAYWGRVRVSPDGNLIFLAKRTTLMILDSSTFQTLNSIGLGGSNTGDLVISPDGKKAYASSINYLNANAHLFEIDTETLAVVNSMSTASGFQGIDVSPSGEIVYATTRYSGKLFVIDATTFEIIKVVENVTSRSSGSLAFLNRVKFSPDGSFAYISTRSGGSFGVVVDTSTHEPYATFPGKGGVIAFIPDNAAPTANAGVDISLECTSTDGTAVVLDGSASTDPDGDTLAYTWTGSFGTASGISPTVIVPFGTSLITLTVDDGNGGTAIDDVVVTVADTTAPITSATLSGTLMSNGWYLGDVLVEVSATDTCSGVARITYTLDGALTIANGDYASATVTATGTHSVVYSATDNEGNTSADASMSMELFTADSDGLVALISTMVGEGLIAPQMENSLVKQAGNGSYNALANHIKAQTGKKIDPEASALLLAAIESITGH